MAIPIPTPTNNPVPSADINDVVFAGAKMDEWSTSENNEYKDRFGEKRLTSAGLKNQVQQFLLSSGYEILPDYVDGPITFTRRNQITAYKGEFYRPNASATLPYTTSGNTEAAWATDKSNFVAVGDAVLRQELFSTVKYIPWLTPQYHGAKGDGVTDDTAAINAMFTSGAESYRIPSGTYLISSTIKQTISKNIRIACEPGVVFKLADNARQHLFQISGNGTTGDGTNTYEWFGGELDGNWSGQGSEPYAANGHFSDISHGMIVCNFYKVEIADLYSHSFMGHNINHGGNTYIHAHDIRFNSHTATNFPQGGVT